MISNLLVLLNFVDYVLITVCSYLLTHQLINKLRKEFTLKNLGKLPYFLGMEVKYFVGGLFLS